MGERNEKNTTKCNRNNALNPCLFHDSGGYLDGLLVQQGTGLARGRARPCCSANVNFQCVRDSVSTSRLTLCKPRDTIKMEFFRSNDSPTALRDHPESPCAHQIKLSASLVRQPQVFAWALSFALAAKTASELPILGSKQLGPILPNS